ncbi:unnamed protein product [Rangifer tarandus platyrhynchus]|uniref:Uncharacterized protein n=2 Tax=Rangifer tarandus platyrhynchus TaxID=3082113 RepID=A0ABN8YN78_RANTA|nr:unnamed protein product [Rangifer tarandus platyrhynchus]
MQNLSSLTRGQTHAPCSGNMCPPDTSNSTVLSKAHHFPPMYAPSSSIVNEVIAYPVVQKNLHFTINSPIFPSHPVPGDSTHHHPGPDITISVWSMQSTWSKYQPIVAGTSSGLLT